MIYSLSIVFEKQFATSHALKIICMFWKKQSKNIGLGIRRQVPSPQLSHWFVVDLECPYASLGLSELTFKMGRGLNEMIYQLGM